MKYEYGSSKKGLTLAVMLIFTFLVQGQIKIVFDDVLNPEKLYIEGEKVYISEEGVINVFSMTNSKKLYQLTKKGEGPGEFKYSPVLTFLPDYIVATGRGKVIFYQRDGKKIAEKRAPSNIQMFPVKGHYIGSTSVMDEKLNKFARNDAIYNADFQKITDVYSAVPESSVIISRDGKTPRQNYYIIPRGNGFITDGSEICLYDSKKGFFIEIYNHEGKKISTINNDYPRIKVSGAYKDRKMSELRKEKSWGQLKTMFNFVFPDYFPAFRRVFINNGLLYVLTDTPKETEQTLVVLDFSGKILARSTMPKLRCRYFLKGKLFYFQENEAEKWVLHIRKLL